jgi:sensor c-di-GMP phosphodiesterase-like protein
LSDPDFPNMLETVLDQARMHARCLGIEITESASARLQPVIETIVLLRRRGHHVYIDDFGTGYSSLSYLHDLSIDGIKIDKTFTHAIGTEAVTVGILPQVMAMADALNLQVVVEGVETEAQAAFFSTAAKPILAQGWNFGYPMPAVEFLRVYAENAQKAATVRHQAPIPIRGDVVKQASTNGDRSSPIQ